MTVPDEKAPGQRFSRPVISFIASVASMEPMTPHVAPMIGKTSGGGLPGKMHRRQGVFPGITVVAWP